MTGTETTSSYAGENSEAVEHRPNELRALSALGFEELRGFPGAIRDMHHLALLNHPEVYERLRGWLKPPGGRSEASSARDFALT